MGKRSPEEDRRQLLLAKIKQELVYNGPDNGRYYRALLTLNKILGYYALESHRKIFRHTADCRAKRRNMTLGFRGLGKSTSGTKVASIKVALEDPNARILITSDTEEAAVALLDPVITHLNTNQLLIEMFGPFFDPRSKTDIGRFRDGSATILQRTDTSLSEPTFLCIGVGGQSASRHFTHVFGDDLVTFRNSKTAVQRANLRAWHDSTLVGTFMPQTRVTYNGTRYYPNDLYDDFENGRPGDGTGAMADVTLKIPLIANYSEARADWVSNEPDLFPPELCRERHKIMGAYHFQAQMQQDTRSGEGIIFNYADFRWYGAPHDPAPAREDMAVFQFSDLAAKKTDTGAFFATATIGVADVGGEKRIYILDLVRERAGMKRQRELIYSQTALWKPISHGVEAVAMQAGFAEEMQQSSLLPVVPVPLTGAEGDKVLRARRISPMIEAHMVYFPEDETPAGVRCAPLVLELTQFPDGDYCDCVDALVGAITLAIYGGPQASSPPDEGGWSDLDSGLLANY